MCNRFRGIVEIPLHELFDTGVRDVPPTWYPLLSKKRQLKELRRSARDAHEELTTAAKQSSWQAFAGRKGIGAGAKKARRLR